MDKVGFEKIKTTNTRTSQPKKNLHFWITVHVYCHSQRLGQHELKKKTTKGPSFATTKVFAKSGV